MQTATKGFGFAGVLTVLSACGAVPVGSGGKDAGPTSTATVTMKVNGQAWTSTSGSGTFSTGAGGNTAVIAKRALADGGSDILTLTMFDLTGPGSWEAKPFSNNEILYTAFGFNDRVREDGGITVTAYDPSKKDVDGFVSITGTFQGRGRSTVSAGSANDVVISDGTFEAKLSPIN